MRAVRCHQFGSVGELELGEVAPRAPGPLEVRVATRFCGLNFADSLLVAGRYQVRPELPFTPGFEASGEVVELGEGVTDLSLGDRVVALPAFGAFAEEIVLPAARTFPCPDSVPHHLAAALPIAYGTAYLALTRRARLERGDWLLVNGAAGGVGLAAVDLGRLLGARVIAAAGSRDKLELAAAYGAAALVDYTREDLAARVKEITSGRGADVAIDPVGGDAFAATLRAMAFEGRVVVIGFAAGDIQPVAANHLLVKNVDALGFYWGGYHRHEPALLRHTMGRLTNWCASGEIRPHVCARFPLAEVAAGIELLLGRRSTGKVLLETDRRDGRKPHARQ
jgi:NADPH2:quinone reductase